MNETIQNILERRSIRKYLPDTISRQDLDLILTAGLYAPSARNRQPWHLCVIQGQEKIDRLTAEVKAAVDRMPENPYKAMVGAKEYTVNYHAPVFIVVSADSEESPMAMADCALVLGSMFLAAQSLGIGSCWINQLGSVCNEAGFRKILTGIGVPPNHTVYGCGAFGFPQTRPSAAPARKEGAVTFVDNF